MKIAVRLCLLLFIVFLATPTIVGAIKKSCDTSYFYSMSEEELAHKEIKSQSYSQYDLAFTPIFNSKSGPILSENNSKHNKVAENIFIPPPDSV